MCTQIWGIRSTFATFHSLPFFFTSHALRLYDEFAIKLNKIGQWVKHYDKTEKMLFLYRSINVNALKLAII